MSRPIGPDLDNASVGRFGLYLYPLGITDYMAVIYDEIDNTKEAGLSVRAKHFCTRLDGDTSQVFAVLRAAFDCAKRLVESV